MDQISNKICIKLFVKTLKLEILGAIHSTKISGNFGPKLNGSVRSNRKSFEKTGPPFEVVLFSRSDRLEVWLNGSRPLIIIILNFHHLKSRVHWCIFETLVSLFCLFKTPSVACNSLWTNAGIHALSLVSLWTNATVTKNTKRKFVLNENESSEM